MEYCSICSDQESHGKAVYFASFRPAQKIHYEQGTDKNTKKGLKNGLNFGGHFLDTFVDYFPGLRAESKQKVFSLVRNCDDRSWEIVQRLHKLLHSLDIQIVRDLVKDKDVGIWIHEEFFREVKSGSLTCGELLYFS